jgi:hypothetical protein
MRATASVAVRAFTMLAIVWPTLVYAQPAPTPPTGDYCVFRNELYSFGAFICIGKNHALRCDGPGRAASVDYRTAHWNLMNQDSMNSGYSDIKLGEACSGAPSAVQQ